MIVLMNKKFCERIGFTDNKSGKMVYNKCKKSKNDSPHNMRRLSFLLR